MSFKGLGQAGRLADGTPLRTCLLELVVLAAAAAAGRRGQECGRGMWWSWWMDAAREGLGVTMRRRRRVDAMVSTGEQSASATCNVQQMAGGGGGDLLVGWRATNDVTAYMTRRQRQRQRQRAQDADPTRRIALAGAEP
jgi:hypothetical protein